VAEIEALIKARLEARQAKDWAAADAARNRLTEMGIIWKMAAGHDVAS
jgi:cysteinyl-tRNA synthetase